MIPRGALVHVECYAGGRGEETPRRLFWRDRWQDLTVLERWLSESAPGEARMRGFRVRLASGQEGVLQHDEALDLWCWSQGRSTGQAS
jgi:hypothetical protein